MALFLQRALSSVPPQHTLLSEAAVDEAEGGSHRLHALTKVPVSLHTGLDSALLLIEGKGNSDSRSAVSTVFR